MTAPAAQSPHAISWDTPPNVRRRRTTQQHTAHLLRHHGTTWAQVKTWAATQTLPDGRRRWMPADLTTALNPHVVDAWARHHGKPHPQPKTTPPAH